MMETIQLIDSFDIDYDGNYWLISDPVGPLESALQWQKKAQRVTDLEVENANFRETLEQYNAEFAEVKNQGTELVGYWYCNPFCITLSFCVSTADFRG